MSIFRRFLYRQKVPKERYKEGMYPFLIYPTFFSQNLPTGKVVFAVPHNAAGGGCKFLLLSKVLKFLEVIPSQSPFGIAWQFRLHTAVCILLTQNRELSSSTFVFLFSKVFGILKPFFQKGFKQDPRTESLASSFEFKTAWRVRL